MLAEQALRAAVRELPLIAIPGPWARAVLTRLLLEPPLGTPQALLTADATTQRPYRFNPAGRFAVHYLAADYETALAEVALTLGRSDPYTVVSVGGVLAGTLDLTDAVILAHLETNVQELTGNWREFVLAGDEAPTQLLGRVLFEETAAVGMRYRSARRPESTSVAVFADRLYAGGASYLEVHDSSGHLRQRLPSV